jgi:hypothetical protein
MSKKHLTRMLESIINSNNEEAAIQLKKHLNEIGTIYVDDADPGPDSRFNGMDEYADQTEDFQINGVNVSLTYTGQQEISYTSERPSEFSPGGDEVVDAGKVYVDYVNELIIGDITVFDNFQFIKNVTAEQLFKQVDKFSTTLTEMIHAMVIKNYGEDSEATQKILKFVTPDFSKNLIITFAKFLESMEW